MRKIIIVAILIHLLLGFITFAHSQTFGPDVPVDTITPGVIWQWSPDIAVDSEGTVGVVWVNQTVTNYVVMFARSTDRGQTWQKTVVEETPLTYPSDARYDPALAFDMQNNPWVVWTYAWYDLHSYSIHLAHSTDGGQSFGPCFHLPAYAREQIARTMAIDEANNVYIPVMDDGKLQCFTFVHGDTNTRISSRINPSSLLPNLYPDFKTVGEDTVYVAWRADSTEGSDINLIYFSKSVDEGSTFSDPVLVSSGPLEGIFGAYSPKVTIDEKKNINIVWADDRTNSRKIYFAKSTDEGTIFQSEKRVNDMVEMEETFPHLVYNQSFGLSVVYLDHQYGQSYDMYFSWSIDKGETFNTSIQIGDSTFWELDQVPYGIDADDSGNVYITFSDNRYGMWFNFVTKINLYITDVFELPHEQTIPTTHHLGQNYPNPFNSRTIIEYNIHKKCFLKLSIYNIQGKKIRTLVNSYLPAGKYQAMWDGTNDLKIPVASGIYFYRTETVNTAIVKKLVLIR